MDHHSINPTDAGKFAADPATEQSLLVRKGIRGVEITGSLFASLAMVILAVRSALRLELRWDTFAYHIPFAARRGGLEIPYAFPSVMEERYRSAPPLAHFLQGILWKLTGQINATGVLNYLGLALFLYFAAKHLKALWWLVTVLCLTVPLVLIHAASSYIDLFTNALLAIGLSSLVVMFLFDRWQEPGLLLWGLAGTVGAAWSKMVVLPVVILTMSGFLVGYAWKARDRQARRGLLLVFVAVVFAAGPCLRNAIVFGNPIWPVPLPIYASHFPATIDSDKSHDEQVPPPLRQLGHVSLFFHSLFEINHPKKYPNRERWIIDQGNAWIAFHSGGFWVVAVITGNVALILLGFLSARRHGWALLGTMGALWLVVSVLPQSHQLRYYQFLPLVIAALTAMLVRRVAVTHPAVTFAILTVFLSEFAWVSWINRAYYHVEKVGWREAAEFYNIRPFWGVLQPGRTYCIEGFGPSGILLTGPTMQEFRIIDHSYPPTGFKETPCPPDALLLQGPRK